MIEMYKTFDGILRKIDKPESGCWINVVCPTDSEKLFLLNDLKLLPEFLKQALDEEESPHIDYDDDYEQRLIIIDYPLLEKKVNKDSTSLQYTTAPLSFVSYNNYIITISLHECLELEDFKKGVVKGLNTTLRTRFFLTLMLRMSGRYLTYLRQIDKLSSLTENKLHKSMENQELIQENQKTIEDLINKAEEGTVNIHEIKEEKDGDITITGEQIVEMVKKEKVSGIKAAFQNMQNFFKGLFKENTNDQR